MALLKNKYRIEQRIGAGGMAEVYRSTLFGAAGFERTVAIKRVLEPVCADPTFGKMFVNEAKIASLLSHPNIVSVLDFDRDDEGRYFLVMELVEGTDLRRLIQKGPVPTQVAAFVASEVLRALAFAHDLTLGGRPLRLVHRDVSPHNILVSWDGSVKLTDFGIAKAAHDASMTRTGLIKGKVAYMSPEQVEGDELDGRSDLFALGIVLYEMLTGNRLFGGRVPERVVLNRILLGEIRSPRAVNPEVPESLARVSMRLLERRRSGRYGTAGEALEALIATGCVSLRGQLELARLMHQRFPDSGVPRPKRDSGPTSLASAPPHCEGATVPDVTASRTLQPTAAMTTRPLVPRRTGSSRLPVAAGLLVTVALAALATIEVASESAPPSPVGAPVRIATVRVPELPRTVTSSSGRTVEPTARVAPVDPVPAVQMPKKAVQRRRRPRPRRRIGDAILRPEL